MRAEARLELPTRDELQTRRAEFIDTLRQNMLRKFGATVTTIGSMKKGDWDAFSDIDLWVSVPDEAKDELLASRADVFADVGDDLVRWERPSFAPIDGIHSIVLYDSDEVAPIEVDYYISPASQDEYYRDFIDCSESSTYDYTWAKGEDDKSAAARVDYSSLVTMWAGKYWHRGINPDEQLGWAWGRFEEVSDEIGMEHDLKPTATVADLTTIIDQYHSRAILMRDSRRARACSKIADTLRLIELIETTRNQ